MTRLAMLLVASTALLGCSTLPTEQRLVGVWRMPERTTENEFGITQWQSKEMAVFTIKPDHTYIWTSDGHAPKGVGRWWLRGQWLISEFTYRKSGRTVTEKNRNKILKLSDRELVFPNNSVWTRVR